MGFSTVLGHEPVRELLARVLAAGRLPHALLFCGRAGIGKKRLALALGRGLLCEKGRREEPCEECQSCRRCLRGLHPDVVLVTPATAVIKIDQVREVVAQLAGLPFEGRARSVVIDSAHLLTEEAANSLLKSLEEPPSTSYVFLVTESPQALLPTIRSRCQELRMGSLPLPLLEAKLKETLPPEEARLRAVLASGSLGDALAFETEGYREAREDLLSLLEKLPKGGALERLAAAERLEERDDLALTLTALRSLLRDIAILHAGAGPSHLLNEDVRQRLASVAAGHYGERAGELAQFAGEIREGLEGNANKLLSLDILLEAMAPVAP